MLKFLYFGNSKSDAACVPVTLLRQMAIDDDSNQVTFRFEDIGDGIGEQVILSVDTNTDKAKDVVDEVAHAIRTSKSPFIVVGDDVNNQYISKEITDVNSVSIT